MNSRYIKQILFFCIGGIGLMQSCQTLDTDIFSEKRALFFEKRIMIENEWKYIDTANISIPNYPGQSLLSYPFKICLIGDTLAEDTEYAVTQVDTLTTAPAGMVTLPEKLLFHHGITSDSLWLTIHTDQVPVDEEYYITFRLVANEHFQLGYKGYLDVKLWFNNKESQPLWWDEQIEKVYLGTWSPKKFETLVLATQGVTSFEDLSASEKRLYALQLKDYIELHGITEADGSPMNVPIY